MWVPSHCTVLAWTPCCNPVTLPEVSVLKRYSCSATPHACPYYFFLCWLVLIFDFFINHAWSIGAIALNMCNYTCRDMNSPLHVLCYKKIKKNKHKKTNFLFWVVCVKATPRVRVTVASYTWTSDKVLSEHHLGCGGGTLLEHCLHTVAKKNNEVHPEGK